MYSAFPEHLGLAEKDMSLRIQRSNTGGLSGSQISPATGNRGLRDSRTHSSSDKRASTASTPFRATVARYLTLHMPFVDGASRTETWHVPKRSSWIERNLSSEGIPIRPMQHFCRYVRNVPSPSNLPYQIEGVVQLRAVSLCLTIMHGLSRPNRTSTSGTSIAFSSSLWRSERYRKDVSDPWSISPSASWYLVHFVGASSLGSSETPSTCLVTAHDAAYS